ncbi:TetR/AcrR family transcriptional regulator [Streptomyces tsukubensis]|uniref:TetR/AcrR family transcriptional regulator n=1 Tax=Streptomyces tsukubensis TaxID=83656 RepID=UPI00098FCB8F|nr:TetR family transcriptional regulator [Streptomyces tsukubensis]QFR95086.1 TetR family transcriptional regulator [Streptomyces tsukubensis]
MPEGRDGAARPPGAARRRGRPPRALSEEGPAARELILKAAREEFAERGYDRTSIRGIAKVAGVDAALVHHYFGTKDDVFAAAIELSFAPALNLTAVLTGEEPGGGDGQGEPEDTRAPHETRDTLPRPEPGTPTTGPGGVRADQGIGERLIRLFIAVWEDPSTRAQLLAVVRSALTHEAAAEVLRGFLLRRLLRGIADELDVPEPRFRAELAASHLVGIAFARYVLKVEPLATADPERIVAMVAPTLQRYLTEA